MGRNTFRHVLRINRQHPNDLLSEPGKVDNAITTTSSAPGSAPAELPYATGARNEVPCARIFDQGHLEPSVFIIGRVIINQSGKQFCLDKTVHRSIIRQCRILSRRLHIPRNALRLPVRLRLHLCRQIENAFCARKHRSIFFAGLSSMGLLSRALGSPPPCLPRRAGRRRSCALSELRARPVCPPRRVASSSFFHE